ncbi:MAG: hypothetical protein V7K62_14975 [Nostoc sp.]
MITKISQDTHYNWYIAVEPESGDYLTDRDELAAINKSRQHYPNAPVFIFRIIAFPNQMK